MNVNHFEKNLVATKGKDPREDKIMEMPDDFVPGPKDIICGRGELRADTSCLPLSHASLGYSLFITFVFQERNATTMLGTDVSASQSP
jgi:hypothetical protein